MKIEDEIKIISIKFGIDELEIKKVIGCKKRENPIKKRSKNLPDKQKLLQEIDGEIQKLESTPKKSYQYIFTQDGYKKLLEKIDDIKSIIFVIGKEIGESCDETETFHDNFDYEEGTRQQHMWSKELKKFLDIKSKARVVSCEESPDSIVSVGKEVTVEYVLTKEIKTFKMGGHISFSSDEISCISPFATTIMGATEGEIRKSKIYKKDLIIKILRIK